MWREWDTIDKCKCNDVKYIFIVATAQQSLDITDLQKVLSSVAVRCSFQWRLGGTGSATRTVSTPNTLQLTTYL